MFLILAVVYFLMMFAGHLLLKKPSTWHEPQKAEKGKGMMDVIKSRPVTNYIGIWLMFYINITCGLALISQEKMIVKCIGLAGAAGIIHRIRHLQRWRPPWLLRLGRHHEGQEHHL